MKKNIFLILVLFFVISIPSVLGFAGGNGSVEAPFEISTCEELQSMNNLFESIGNYGWAEQDVWAIDKHLVLVNDIDCSDTVNWNNGTGFKPISAYGLVGMRYGFIGVLDGRGHSINDLFIFHDKDNEDLGPALFTEMSAGEIKNLHLNNLTIISYSNSAAGLVGFINNNINFWSISGYEYIPLVIDNVSVTGSITIPEDTEEQFYMVGGLIASFEKYAGGGGEQVYVFPYVLSNSWTDVDINVYCYNKHGFPCYNVGGLVGSIGSDFDDQVIVKESYALGNINITGNNDMDGVGGLVGTMFGGKIQDSFARGNLFVDTSGEVIAVGGLAGGIGPGGIQPVIIRSYATGKVIADTIHKDSFVGQLYDYAPNEAVLENNFFDSDTSGFNSGRAFGLKTAAMKSGKPFLDAGWDFVNVWGIHPSVNEGYPNLETTGIVVAPDAPPRGGGGGWPQDEEVEEEVVLAPSPEGGAPLFALFGEQGDFVEWWNDLPWTKHLVWLFLVLLFLWLLSQQQKKKKQKTGKRK